MGTIGLSLLAAGRCSSLICTEVEPSGQAAFAASLAALQQSSPHPRQTLVEAEYIVTNAAALDLQLLAEADVIIVDPPRKGLEEELVTKLCAKVPAVSSIAKPAQQSTMVAVDGAAEQSQQAQPQRLIYLSCGLTALLQDLQALTWSKCWRIWHAESFIFFPGADAIETLVVLEKR